MAWDKSSQNGYMVATETIVISSGSTSYYYSSPIDFMENDTDYTLFSNVNLGATINDGQMTLKSCNTSNGVYSNYVTNLAAFTSVGVGVRPWLHKSSPFPPAPYYKIAIKSAAGAGVNQSIKVMIVGRERKGTVQRY